MELDCAMFPVLNEQITPADVERAAKVVRISDLGGEKEIENTLEQVLDSALKARGREVKRRGYKIDAPDYDLAYLNPSCDIEAMIFSMGDQPRGSICLDFTAKHSAPAGRTA